jgi:hypothetical protein
VLEAVLSGSDPRYSKIIGQLQRAPEIHREYPTPDTFSVGPTSTFDDLSFHLEVGHLASEWLRVTDERSERELEFRVVLGRHGFLMGLEGRTVDGGPWPSDWELKVESAKRVRPDLLKLPSIAEQDRMEAKARDQVRAWLDHDLPLWAQVYPPARESSIAERERHLDARFADGFRTFLGITDGLDLRDIHLYGTADVYVTEGLDIRGLVIGWAGDDEDDYVVVLSRDGGVDEAVYRMNIHEQDGAPVLIAPTFASYLGGLIRDAQDRQGVEPSPA